MKRENKKKDIESFRKYLKQFHKGFENVINCKQLQLVFGIDERTVREYVSLLRKKGVPICSCYRGYFYPERYSDVMDNVMRFNKYLLTLSGTNANMMKSKI